MYYDYIYSNLIFRITISVIYAMGDSDKRATVNAISCELWDNADIIVIYR